MYVSENQIMLMMTDDFRRQALLCVLADNCDEPMYKNLVQTLCSEHQIPLVKVDSNKKLGEWSGLCKIDKTGNSRKIVGCSCAVIKVSYNFKSIYVLIFLFIHLFSR